MYKAWCADGPESAEYDTSESGWMEGAQFLKWFKNVFLKHVDPIDGFKILFVDGHASHMSLELKQLAAENSVLLYRIPGHLRAGEERSGIFDSLKAKWCDSVLAWLAEKGFKSVDKRTFPQIMRQIVEKGFVKAGAVAGFEECGIYPLNRQKIIIRSKKSVIGTTPVTASKIG